MNKLHCILIILFFTHKVCESQNLIPNGDFEQYTSCPYTISQIYLAPPWFQPSTGTTDYYNQCASPQFVGVPNHATGYQPARSGEGYAGFGLVSNIQNYREYLSIQLLSPLVAGNCYHLEFYVNLRNNYKFTTDALGAYFSSSFISVSNNNVLPFIPQISNPTGNLPDTLNWILVSGNLTATGGENYITIGNFKNDTNSPLTIADSSATASASYILIEDVSLTLCTGIYENNKTESINIFPNPFSEKLNITKATGDFSEIILYDIALQKLQQQEFISSITLNTAQLAKGIYLYEVRNKNGVIKKGKVVKD